MSNSFIITDDHPISAKALGNYLESSINDKCLGTFHNIEDTLKYMEEARKGNCLPDYAIIDINLGRENGIDLIKDVKKTYRSVKIICYSMYVSASYVKRARQNGAHGYVSKAAEEEELIRCIKTVVSGGYYIQSDLEQKLNIYTNVMLSLTNREVEIADLIQQNLNNKQIADRLCISKNTVANYTTSIYEKLLGLVDNSSQEDKRQKLIQFLNECGGENVEQLS